ncbi:RusA family crossover junction endodeoxyribonuclease [Xanthobacter flavus]|uniref:RusA family crossover junction endodeoxyribonuclease n=1 Tax=Xanthobacter flavus TaxID=281 RepID=UPI003727BCF2
MTVVLTLLTPPPSLNGAFRNVPGKGRVKTKAYKDWRQDAAWQIKAQRPPRFGETVAISIQVPRSVKADLDNLNKAVLDALQDAGVVANDRQCERVSICRSGVALTTIHITSYVGED